MYMSYSRIQFTSWGRVISVDAGQKEGKWKVESGEWDVDSGQPCCSLMRGLLLNSSVLVKKG